MGQGRAPVRAGAVPCRRRSGKNFVPGGPGEKEMLLLLDILCHTKLKGLVRTTQQSSSETITWWGSPHGMTPTSSSRSSVFPGLTHVRFKPFGSTIFIMKRSLEAHKGLCIGLHIYGSTSAWYQPAQAGLQAPVCSSGWLWCPPPFF